MHQIANSPAQTTTITSRHNKDQLIRGLFSETLQTDILAKASYFKSLEDIIKHAEAFEAAQRNHTHLAAVQASSSTSYRKLKGTLNKPPNPCSDCGSTTHGQKVGND